MNIYHIVEDFSIESGGIRPVVKDLIKNVPITSKVITVKKELSDKNVEVFNSKAPWRYSNRLNKFLVENSNVNKLIYHLHGVWMYPQFNASKNAIKFDIPFLISPHGMYQSWLWKQATFKKKLYFNLLTKNKFKNANIIHAITDNEKNNLHKLFPKTQIEVIPNLISIKNIPSLELKESGEKYILFLGRIHQVKGIKILIEAYSKINQKEFKLKIAGPNSIHKSELIEYVKKLNIDHKVEFVGMISGNAKYELYKNAHVFVAPSYSEVVGMVNLEAALMGTPVITTYQTGLYKEWNNEGGILINPNVIELKKALSNAMSWGKLERNERGKRLKEFVIKNYSWEKNGYKWEKLYRSLI
jgi:glycosyltransferase involved in cell wall biosynthesis